MEKIKTYKKLNLKIYTLFEEFFKKHLELIFLRFNFDMIKEMIARVLLPGIREE
jgi:hypothetical protein